MATNSAPDATAKRSALRRATARRSASEDAWRKAISDAHASGLSMRDIAPLAGVSHSRVQQLLNE